MEGAFPGVVWEISKCCKPTTALPTPLTHWQIGEEGDSTPRIASPHTVSRPPPLKPLGPFYQPL